ncbi:MAG TPA: carboxypeptidase-like regulatory domain-containing protein, partial [Longimicrobium sp.]
VGNVSPVWRLALLGGLVLGGAAACEQGLTSAPGGAVANVTQGSGSITGRVVSLAGQPIAGAQITTPAGAAAVTNADGAFIIGNLPATERLAVNVAAPGFATGTAIYRVNSGTTSRREVVLMPRGEAVAVNAGTGGVVSFAGGGRVTIRPNAFQGVGPGEMVQVSVTYFDPESNRQLSAAPGDFSATEQDGTASQLETAGMIDIRATNAQNAPLSLAPGQTVTVNFPDRDGPAMAPWGLYSFDRTTGTWVGAGSAPADPDGTQRADIPSINTPWNADKAMFTTCITVRVEDKSTSPVAGEHVVAQGVNYAGITPGHTDNNGSVDLLVRSSSIVDVTAGGTTQTYTTPPTSTKCTFMGTFTL